MQQVGWMLPHLPAHSSHLKQQPKGLIYFREGLLKSWIQNSPGGDAAKSGHGTSSSSSIKNFSLTSVATVDFQPFIFHVFKKVLTLLHYRKIRVCTIHTDSTTLSKLCTSTQF